KIREKFGILIFMSIGERPFETYKKLYNAGAYGALLRFESSNKNIYHALHTGRELTPRLKLIRQLKQHGFILATGFMVGLPGETEQDLINNILLTKAINPDMFSFGPFILHSCTPLSSQSKVSLSHMLKTIALTRIVAPDSHILVTSAMETLDKDAKRAGLLAGANSLMINTTPEKYAKVYDIYPNKSENEKKTEETIRETLDLLYSLGRAPTDLSKDK
ncbi:MAG: [FeFe] hydrogenase H-cluster radical SAM maturase HydE, partial [Candidatus Micrarchaeota archaeon]